MANKIKAIDCVPERLNKVSSFTEPADHLVTVVLLGKKPERGLDDSTTQTKHLRKQIVYMHYLLQEPVSLTLTIKGKGPKKNRFFFRK